MLAYIMYRLMNRICPIGEPLGDDAKGGVVKTKGFSIWANWYPHWENRVPIGIKVSPYWYNNNNNTTFVKCKTFKCANPDVNKKMMK